MDPFVSLTAAAKATRRLRVGTGVCLVVQRDPIQTAKLVASLDQVSGGRFLFGVGNGWNAEEIANHGTAFATRHKLTRERIEAMRTIWDAAAAGISYGEFVDFAPMVTWPKPVQKPHPPVDVGGAFPYAARRALRYGDGWMPHHPRRPAHDDVGALLPQFRKMAAEAGREEFPVTVWDAREDYDTLRRYLDLGVVRVAVSVDSEKAEKILPVLDRYCAELMRRVNG